MSKITLSDYTDFKEDILKHMGELIRNFEFDVYEDPHGVWGLLVWLENDFCKIFFDALSVFPKKEVTFHFYKKNTKEFLDYKIPQKLFHSYNICEEEFKNYVLELNTTLEHPDSNPFNEYRKSLMVHEKIILKYYIPILNP